jgi:hypothetical protein
MRKAARVWIASLAILVAGGCARLTGRAVGQQVQTVYPYSADDALPQPLARSRWLRRATSLAVGTWLHRRQQHQHNDLDHYGTRTDALSFDLPGAPHIR